MVFIAISAVLTAGQHARLEFYRAEVSALIASLIVLSGIYWALPRYGIAAAAWSMVIRVSLQVALVAPAFGWCTVENWSRDHLLTVWHRIRPLLMGSTIYKLGPVVDGYLGSMAPAGGLSLLVFAQRTVGAFLQVADKSVAAPMVPLLARLGQKGDMGAFRSVYFKRVAYSLGLGIGLYVVFLGGGKTILSWFLEYGRVRNQNISLLFHLLVVLGGMFIGGVIGQLSAAGLYALTETGAVTRVAIISFVLSVIVKFIGFHYWGIFGIAAGIAFYQVANAAFLNIELSRKTSSE
jgi:putative peptidoglycan lipid II flippase